MGEATILVGHRYIVGRREYAVIQLANGERLLGKIIGWADGIGRPCPSEQARYLVAECGRSKATARTLLVEIPTDRSRV